MSVVQAIISSIPYGAATPSGEPGSPGTNQTYLTNVAPTTGATWSSITGPDATVYGTYTYTNTPNNGIILDNGSYISVPVNLNQGYWSVQFVAEFNPTGYWATMWGNEYYSGSSGYFAYQPNSTTLEAGSPWGTNTYDISNSNGTRNSWTFTNNGGVLSVYKNGQLLNSSSTSYVYPNGSGPGTIFFGARHNNSNTSIATDMNSGTFYYMEIRDYAMDQSYIADMYNNNLKITYQLP
jgi:hypothetical protein